jgi:hypothetical protein
VLLERWASSAAGGPVRVGRLDLRLWRGEASAAAVSLRLEGTSLDVERVEVAWSPATGPAVRLVRPSILVRDSGEPPADEPPSEGLAARPWRALAGLAGASVVEGRIELRDAGGEPWLVLGRVDAEMTGAGGRRRLAVRVADAAAGWPGGGPAARPLVAEGALALDGERLVVEEARLASGTSSIGLRGGLDRLSPITADVEARVALDGAVLAALSPARRWKGASRRRSRRRAGAWRGPWP